jgi:DNA-binding NarL/FixJ family response regulator
MRSGESAAMVTFSLNQQKPRSRVVIVDDHEAIVEMMTPIVESMPGYSVVGHAQDTVHAVETCRRVHPDVLVLDLVLQNDSGLTVLEEVKRVCPFVRVLVFSGNIWSAALRGALSAGVHGVVEKMSSLQEFRTALQAVREGRVYFTPFVSEQIKEMVSRGQSGSRPPIPLSTREKTVLRHFAEGFSTKEIAAKLGLSAYTVVNHRSNLMRKIGLRSPAQLSLYAAEIGVTGGTSGSATPFR